MTNFSASVLRFSHELRHLFMLMALVNESHRSFVTLLKLTALAAREQAYKLLFTYLLNSNPQNLRLFTALAVHPNRNVITALYQFTGTNAWL